VFLLSIWLLLVAVLVLVTLAVVAVLVDTVLRCRVRVLVVEHLLNQS